MSIIKIEKIYLYTDQTDDSANALSWFAENEITDFVNLNYPDPTTHQNCFNPLNTWTFADGLHTFTAFPFVHYTEVHDDLPEYNMPVVLLKDLSSITSSNLAELYKLGR